MSQETTVGAGLPVDSCNCPANLMGNGHADTCPKGVADLRARLAASKKRERADRAAIRGAMHILKESAPSSFAGAWLPDFEKAHAAAIKRAQEAEP